MAQINIREATTEDLPALLAFEQGVVAAERPYNASLKDGIIHYYDIAELLASSQSLVLVAEDAGRMVGTGHGSLKQSLDYLFHDRHAYLGLMYVDPEYRGQGVIQRIIEQLIDWARGQGVDDFYLDVYAENRSALRAYEKYGFKQGLIEMKLHGGRD